MRPLRFLTAASLFDGHDVSINIMRRLLQRKGAEVIHLGHNRSAKEVVDAAIQEDVNAIALSSYQGGHNEYFSYIKELLNELGAHKILIFGGGGGVITPTEIKELESRGITKIYSPEDGMVMGLDGIIQDMIDKANFDILKDIDVKTLQNKYTKNNFCTFDISKAISFIENTGEFPFEFKTKEVPVLGITGTGGAGKSSLIDEILLRFHRNLPEQKIALISVDPTKRKTNGALLGDRIRLGSASFENFYIRSMATRDSKTELAPNIDKVISFLKGLDFQLIIVETSGIGQAADCIVEVSDKSMYVMTPEYGAQTQLEKIEMLEMADFIVLNKFERNRADDALRDIRKQYRRNHNNFPGHPGGQEDKDLPVYGTMASQFNDVGVNTLFSDIVTIFQLKEMASSAEELSKVTSLKSRIIPPERSLYLRDISKSCRDYQKRTDERIVYLDQYETLLKATKIVDNLSLESELGEIKGKISPEVFLQIEELDKNIDFYKKGSFSYNVRGKEHQVTTKYTSLSGLDISRVGFPRLDSLQDKYYFLRRENLPGHFPYASGIFPFKRSDEDPKRMFAGEGGPLRTNKRFHYLSKDDNAKRLSTAFDSATLYGEDPHERPDIFGKIGEAGVSIATLDDMKDLFKGFELTAPNTSVSMTINGPAPIILAMFMNTAIGQVLDEKSYFDFAKRIEVMQQVRGTVQADILKEDQAQNTCIFSLEFSLKLMGDVQEFFCNNKIRNYYTVSVSGYHIAEAGANPITQVAFTMANGFTFVEYYLSRGMHIDDICQNLSFFFSNGLDPEYAVIGSVARKIWAVTLKYKYGANTKSQKFKYHIQTSGRSLHAQEIDFNDIRTTLQAFLALSDNCNSLHTNAYDEAITTPTEDSVRRAMAIQMIINREFGLNKTDNPMQGSFLVEELSELVEEAILQEFERISDKGGVLGAMESMYQRGKIQEESLYYEGKKDSGEMPIIGVNTYLAENISEQLNQEIELSRCSDEEKLDQIKRLKKFHKRNEKQSQKSILKLKDLALSGGNIFEELLETVNYCSLGEITEALYEIGGKYRRNM
jgi:isobutyryl-CoA mutase